MKKLIALMTIALAVASLAVAQATPDQSATAQPTVKIEGKLALVNGRIAVKQGDKTYYLNNVSRLAGFVDGIKEGAQVKAEGYACQVTDAPEYSYIAVTKLTVGGKDYDLSQTSGRGMMGGRGMGTAGCDGTGCNGTANATGRMGNRGGMMGGRR